MGELSERIKRLEEKTGLVDMSNLPALPPNPDKPKLKKKKFGMPFRGRVGKQKARKGWVSVIKVMDNKVIDFEKQQVVDQTVMVDEVPRVVMPGNILSYRGKPAVVISTNSVTPVDFDKLHQSVENSQLSVKGHKLLLARMLGEVIQAKKKMNMAIIFGLLVVLIAGGYFLSKQGFFN